jgi:hypothetical protein
VKGLALVSEIRNTYVYHESTRATLAFHSVNVLLSKNHAAVPLCVVLSEQSYDSSTGQGERASVERPFVAGHLQDTSVSATKGGGKATNVSSCSFRLTLGEERLRPRVSTGDTCFA